LPTDVINDVNFQYGSTNLQNSIIIVLRKPGNSGFTQFEREIQDKHILNQTAMDFVAIDP